MKYRGIVLAALIAGGVAAPAAQARDATIVRIELTGPVDPLLARYAERVISRAGSAAAILITIDTPGGLESSMRSIIRSIESSKTAVTCWVGPSGARAASAGALILLSCPYATMAPGTEVGAAHPVGITGGIMSEKVTNDAAAFARSLALTHGRNADLAERMVRDSVSVSAQEALRDHIIGAIASSEREALRGLAGPIVSARMSLIEALLHHADDPNLAFLLFVFGLAGIVFEVFHPGISVPGIVGGFSFLLSLVILGTLPVNIAGLILLVFAVGFFAVEAHGKGHGVGAALGIGALVLGALFMFNASVPTAHVSIPLIVAAALILSFVFLVVARKIMLARHQAPRFAPPSTLVGETAIVERTLDPQGVVRARGESWTATSPSKLDVGAHVRITAVHGLQLEVEPVVAVKGE